MLRIPRPRWKLSTLFLLFTLLAMTLAWVRIQQRRMAHEWEVEQAAIAELRRENPCHVVDGMSGATFGGPTVRIGQLPIQRPPFHLGIPQQHFERVHSVSSYQPLQLDPLREFPRLRMLDLQAGLVDGEVYVPFETWPDLEEICIRFQHPGPELGRSLQGELDAVARLQGLKKLTFEATNHEAVLGEPLCHLRAVEWLSLDGVHLTEDDLANMRSRIRLKYLRLENAGLTDDVLRPLADYPKLEQLCLGGDPLTGRVGLHLAKIPRLRFLALSDSEIGLAILPYVKDFPALEDLSLAATAQQVAEFQAVEKFGDVKVVLFPSDIEEYDQAVAAAADLQEKLPGSEVYLLFNNEGAYAYWRARRREEMCGQGDP